MERYLLTRVLRETGGNQSLAAKMLGITRGSLRNKIRSLRLSIDHVVTVSGVGRGRRLTCVAVLGRGAFRFGHAGGGAKPG